MLKQTITSINKVLDNLIKITKQDIQDINRAKHNELFERNIEKDRLINEFSKLKSNIDSILVKRSQSRGMDNLLDDNEQELLEEFKTKIKEFYELHKKFAKMALSVANFYNGLMDKLNGHEIDIGYKNAPKSYSTFSLKA